MITVTVTYSHGGVHTWASASALMDLIWWFDPFAEVSDDGR